MYHEISAQERKQKQKRRIVALVLACVIAVAGIFVYRGAKRAMNEQAAAAMRQSIMDAAMQCCAIEGAYPLTLGYLEENYGLTINHDDFVITYQSFANNVAPSVVVMSR